VYGAYIKEQEIGAKNVLWGPERGYGSRGIRSGDFGGIRSGDFGGIRSGDFGGIRSGDFGGIQSGEPLGGHQKVHRAITRWTPGG